MKIYIHTPHFENLKKELENKLQANFSAIEWALSPLDTDINIYDQTSWHEASLSDKNILLSSEEDEFNIVNLLQLNPCKHLIGFSIDLMSEIQKSIQLILSSNFWNIKENFGEFEQRHTFCLAESDEIKTKLKPLLEKINLKDQFNSSFNIVYLLSNELLMNAFFHHKDVKTRRTESISLDVPIDFEIGVNPSGILLKVKDTNGGFPYEKLISSLSRGFSEKAPRSETSIKEGAGLGLYFIYKMSNQLILNVTEGVGTEIFCLIETSKRYKQYTQRVSSLHYHTRIE